LKYPITDNPDPRSKQSPIEQLFGVITGKNPDYAGLFREKPIDPKMMYRQTLLPTSL